MFSKYRIDRICELIKGEYPTLKTPPGEYPLVVTASFRRSADSYQIDGKAVCIPLISSTGHGNAALHRIHYQEGRFAVANLLVVLMVKDENRCYPKYLYHLLNTKRNEYFVPLMKGSANVSLKISDIASVEIPLPPLSEQHRIVSKIEQLSIKIEERRKLQREIEEESNAMLRSAFKGLLKGSDWYSMKEIAPIIRRPVDIKSEEFYPELGVRSFGKGTFHKKALSGYEVGTKKLYWIYPGDLMFHNVFSWEGAMAVAKKDDQGRVGSHRFITCVPKEGKATSDFLCFYFLTQEGLYKIGQASPGGAGRNRTLGLKKLEKIEVPVPSYEKQIWFNNLQAKVASMKALQDKTTTKIDSLLPSILDKAFKGEL